MFIPIILLILLKTFIYINTYTNILHIYSVAFMSTKCVNGIILCHHACNELCRELQTLSLVLTDNSQICGSLLDLLLISK